MIKRLLLYTLAGAMLLAVAISADRGYKGTALLGQYSAEIAAYLQEQEAAGLAWVQENRSALSAALAGRLPGATDRWAAALAQQAEAPYTLLVHRGDSLLFYSNNKAIPSAEQLARIGRAAERSAHQLPLGYYYAYRTVFEAENRLTVLIPIRYTLNEGGQEYRQGLFPANPAIVDEVALQQTPNEFPVRVHGQDVCWLQASGPVQAAWVQWIKLAAFGLFLALFLILAGKTALRLVRRGWVAPGAGLLLALVTAIFWLNRQTGFTAAEFSQLPLFARQFHTNSIIGTSLGDWLLHLALLLWLMLFFHRAFRVDHPLDRSPLALRLGLGVVCYALVLMSTLVGVEVFRQLVFHSAIHFDFDNLLNVDSFAVLAFGGILLLLLALFLFGHRLMLTALQLGLPLSMRALGLAVSAAIFYLIALAYQDVFQVSALYLVVLGVVYVVAFDAFLELKVSGLAGIILWLMLASLVSALLLYRYNYLKDKTIRENYVVSLANGRDSVLAEPQLRSLVPELQKDTQLNRLLKPWPFKPLASEMRRHLNELLFEQRYLFQHYRLEVYAFDKDGLVLPQDQAGSRDVVVRQNWAAGAPLPGAPEIRCHRGPDGVFRYMLQLQALRMNDPTQPAELYCFFDHQYPQTTRVYSELFYQLPYKNLERLQEYDFAVQYEGKLVVDRGQANQLVFNQSAPAGQVVEQLSEAPRRVDAVYKTANGKTIASVGRPLGGWYKQLYLFAVLFSLSSLFIFLLAALNNYLSFLPDYYQFSFNTKGSLAKRIHYGNFALIGLAFLAMGALTYQHFSQAALDAKRTNLDGRAEAFLTHLRNRLGPLAPNSDSLKTALPETLSNLASSFSTDVNVFTPQGRLLFSSQPELAQLGILPQGMSPQAFALLAPGDQREAVVSEQLAGVGFSNRYLPLHNEQNELLGFLGVPYYLSERKIGPEVSDFIGLLASVYVFLLLIAYSVSYLLSRSIIRPVQLISDKIKLLQLEDKNEPLEYAGDAQDELSSLIDEYNRMVEKLEASKSQLIRLERESAWREMARQVAHDIKNPLTTMKLSMQQLERVSADPAQAALYLKKAITRLIEQIDSLAQIASEFSMFANLDIRQKHDLVLNDVVESVYDLFSEQKDVQLLLDIPKERYHILGDKNHLIRVFNNLVINAIQAIPSDRKGVIRVSLNRQGENAVVQINDNGGGIPDEIQKRVFEPNFTTKTSGSGLGLAICRKIVEALDGTIRFETREGDGTDFFVELPITAMEQ